MLGDCREFGPDDIGFAYHRAGRTGDQKMLEERVLSNRFASLKPSATVEMTEKVRQLRLSGKEIIGFSSGDPNIDAHPAIIKALNDAIKKGETNYGPPQGKEGLRKALSTYLTKRSDVDFFPEEIIITPGGKFAVYAAIMAIVNPTDEVIVLEPGWVSYSPCIRLAGGIPVGVSALNSVNHEELERKITPRTKAIIINSPVNPTGRIISKNELQLIAELAREHNLWIISDEVYSELVFEPHRHFSISAIAGMKERTFLVDSFSKTFGMTGWRLGCLALPRTYVKDVIKIIQHSIYCVPPFMQSAAEEAMNLLPDIISDIRNHFCKKVAYAWKKLDALPGFSCPEPQATFYLFPQIQGDDRTLAMKLLENLNIAVMPGIAFGSSGKGHIRFSITCSTEQLAKAMFLLEQYFNQEKT